MKVCALLLMAFLAISLPALASEPRQLWLYYATNLAVDKNVTELDEIWTRAAKAGYTHVILTDSKFAKLGDLGDMEKHYFSNIARVKKIAADLHLQIVPAMFDIGYSNNMLWHDPNLAEGLPVKDQPFIVHGDQATPAGDPAIVLGKKFSFKDDNVIVTDGIATVDNNTTNARFSYHLKVPKYRCYRLSTMVKTEHFSGEVRITAIDASGTKRTLQWQDAGIAHDQDWKLHQVIFNTLDSDAVNIYFGIWGPGKGKLQWKDWKIEELGPMNVLRRPGTPCIVKLADGTALVEGKDYAPIVDPGLGNHPYKGEFDVTHAAPAIKVLDGAKLPDGTRLLVSWYHPVIIYAGQVAVCISEPKTMTLLADEAKRVKSAWSANGYMMGYDEFRCCGWDEACVNRAQTPGQMLADNVRQCTKLLDGSETYTWSDMFDPHHNAVKGPYFLVNGDWLGSWEGLDRHTVIINWNSGHRDESLKFFADRGHRQIIAGFYDSPVEKNTAAWIAAADKVPGVAGIMYTTWRHDFSKLEAFAKAVRSSP